MDEYILQGMEDIKRAGWKLPTIIGVTATLAGGLIGAGIVLAFDRPVGDACAEAVLDDPAIDL